VEKAQRGIFPFSPRIRPVLGVVVVALIRGV
jgi:hypothetical protein